MTETDNPTDRSESPFSQVKKLAQEMAAGQLGLIEGVRMIVDLRHSLFAHGATDPDFDIIMDFERDTRHLPVGSVRRNWSSSALVEKDVEMSALQRDAHDRVMAAVMAVIGRLEARTSARRSSGWRSWWLLSRGQR
jgi:hypothetical protein